MIDSTLHLGKIPNEWEYVNARMHLLLESGQRPSDFVTDDPNDIPSLGGENISSDGFISLDNIRFISKDYFVNAKKGFLLKNDIIINKDGANTGKVAFVNQLPFNNCLINEHLFTIRNKGEFVQEYLFYFFLSWFGQRQIQSRVIGSAQPGFGNSFIKGLFVPKPPKPEQTAIASILSAVDNSILATKETIKKAERLKKALMQNLLTGKQKPNGILRTENEFYTDERFGKVPKGWKVEKLRKVVNKITDGEHLTPELQDKGELLLSAEDVFEDGIRLEKAKYVKLEDWIKFRNKCNPEFGDVLLVSRGASIGRTCQVETDKLFSLMGSVILIKPNNITLHGNYISQYLKSYQAKIDLIKLSGTTAQQAIYMSDLNKLKVLFPTDINEQNEIAIHLNNYDKLNSRKKIKLQKLERLKKSLMQNLLTGKVRIKNLPLSQLGKDKVRASC